MSYRFSSSSGLGGAIGGCFIGLFGAGFMAIVYFGLWAAVAALVGLWTDRNLDFWVSHVKGVPTDVPFWVAWVSSIPVPFTILGNIISEVAKYFV